MAGDGQVISKNKKPEKIFSGFLLFGMGRQSPVCVSFLFSLRLNPQPVRPWEPF